jgi:hypothetical protein
MTLTSALLPVPSPRSGPTVADLNAGRAARLTEATNRPPPPAADPVRTPWRWNPGRHERMRPARSDHRPG